MRALAGSESWDFFFWPSLLNRLLTLASPGDKTVHLCFQGAQGLVHALERNRPNSLVTLGKPLHFSAPQFPRLQMGMKNNLVPMGLLIVIRANSYVVLSMEPGTQKARNITCYYMTIISTISPDPFCK